MSKPANIIAAERGGAHDVAKLIDFGLARKIAVDGDQQQPGTVAGSPLCMSPEQAKTPELVHRRSDLYSLGVTGYCLATGQFPFEGENPFQIVMVHASRAVDPPSMYAALSAELERVLLKALEKEASRRFQSAGEMLQALSQCGSAGSWSAADASQWWHDHAISGSRPAARRASAT